MKMKLVYEGSFKSFRVEGDLNEINRLYALRSAMDKYFRYYYKAFCSTNFYIGEDSKAYFRIHIQTIYLEKGELGSVKQFIKDTYKELKAECLLPKLSDEEAQKECKKIMCGNYMDTLFSDIRIIKKGRGNVFSLKSLVEGYKKVLALAEFADMAYINSKINEIKEFLPAEFLQELEFVPARKVSHPRKKAIARAKALLRNYYSMVA